MTIQDLQRVEQALGDRVICQLCGATIMTYGDECSVALDVACEGFLAVEETLASLGISQ